MILRMRRIRVLGPRSRIGDVLDVLQDLEAVHLDDAREERVGVRPPPSDEREERARHLAQLRKAARAVGAALDALGGRSAGPVRSGSAPSDDGDRDDVARWVRSARSVRREAERIRERIAELEDERALLERYRTFFTAFEPLIGQVSNWAETTAFHVILEEGRETGVDEIRRGLDEALESEYELWSRKLPTGETALLLLVRSAAAERMEDLLSETRVREIGIPESIRSRTPGEAVERISGRLEELPRELERLRQERERLRRDREPELSGAETAIRDRILELEARGRAAYTARAFVLEGWIPAEERPRLDRALRERVGEEVVVEEVGEEQWATEQAPVVLRNPRLFKPFEAIVGLLPLPRYGTMDPTPFVAVFFPMFFGLILGDVAYGALLGGLAVVLHRRSEPDTLLRSVAKIAGACAAFTIIFGFLFGELLGDLGRRSLGLEPILFDREEALVPFLGLAVALGAVHLLLGLVLNILSAFRRDGPREAVGPVITMLMVVLILLAILAAVEVLPRAFFNPAVVAALVAFPVLVVVEGLVAPMELLSTLGRMLSYARIMALGTASVMMAVAANRMIGGLGSVVVGALFALLFHAVNFVLGVFSPTIHALRLHYVEFFGTFYSPGGTEYRPFGHWKTSAKEVGGDPAAEERNASDEGSTAGSRSRQTTLERR